MADLGRISGPMLKANLERLGVDLVFENQLGDNNLYIEANSLRIGINTNNVSRELTVDGTTQSSVIIVDNDAQLTNLYVDGDTGTITSYDGDVSIIASGTLFADTLETTSLIFNDNYIQGVISNENIELNPNGTGSVILDSAASVTGNIEGGANLVIQGNVTFGNDIDTDTIIVNAEIIGDLYPTINDTFSIGSETKKWNEIHSALANGEFLATNDVSSVANLNPNVALRPGNLYYVSTLGIDSGPFNDGTHQLGGFRTIKHALSFATAGDTVIIYPGVYQEEFPLVVPTGVSIIGKGIRSVTVVPTVGTNSNDGFLLNGETLVSDLSIKDFFYNSTTDTGYGFRFDSNASVTSRSPYVQNISVITSVNGVLPAGRGALVDGSSMDAVSKEASMLFHSVTFITPGAIGLFMTNGARVEWLNSFTYFAEKGLYATNGTIGRISADGSTVKYGAEIRSIGSANVYGNVGAEGDGDQVLMYLVNHNFAYIGTGTDSSNDPSLVNQENETVTVNDARIYWQSDDHSGNFRVGEAFFVDQDTGLVTFNGIGQSVSGINEIIFSTGDDITILNARRVETGNIVFQNNLLSTTTGNLNIGSAVAPQTLQSSNIAGNLELTGNLSIDGTINIGNLGAVDLVTFASEIDSDIIPKIADTSSLGSTALVWKSIWLGQANIGDIVINNNKIFTTSSNSDLELYAAGTGTVVFENLQINTGFDAANVLTLSATDIAGNVNQTGDQTVLGSVDVTGNYQLSNNLSLSVPSLSFGNISVDSNVISTVESNSNLELLANGTGNIYVPVNDVQVDQNIIYNTIQSSTIQTDEIISNVFDAGVQIQGNLVSTTTQDLVLNAAGLGKVITGDILVDQSFTVYGTSELKSTSLELTNLSGLLALTGNSQLVGDLSISNDLQAYYVTFQNVAIQGNLITSTIGNNDLVLQAGGTGKVIFANNVLTRENVLVQNTVSATAANVQDQVTSTQLITAGVTVTTGTGIIGDLDENSISGVLASNNLNENLILSPLGILNIIDTNVNVNFDITVLGTSTFGGLNNISSVGHVGDRIAIGNSFITGSTEIQQSLTVGGSAQYQNLKIDDNTLSSTADIIFSAPLTKTVNFNSELLINNSLIIQGDLYSNDLTVNVQAQGSSVFVDSILIQENFITTTISNANLELRTNGTGVVRVTDNFEIINNVDINSNSTLLATSVTDLSVTGSINRTGSIDQTGDLFVTGTLLADTFTNSDITISGNTVSTTDSDSDLELVASGGIGNIVIPNANLVIENDLTVNDAYIAVQNITFPNDVSSDIYETDQLRFQNNYIEATVSNTDIELAAHGTGKVIVEPTLEVNTGTFSLTGNAVFTTTSILGILGITGTRQHVGAVNLSGEYNLDGDLLSSGQVEFEDYNFVDFRIATTRSNSDVDLRAAGLGKIVFNDGVRFGQDLSVLDTTFVRAITGTTVLTDQLFTGNIRIKDNFIETTLTDSNLVLIGLGTGGVRIERIQITNNILSTVDTNTNLIVVPYTGRFVDIDKTNAVKLPVGTTVNKPSGTTGELRFNSSINRFEGWTNTGPITYGGIFSRNRATSVRALDTNVLDFTINNTSRMTVDSSGVNLQTLLTGTLLLSGNTIASVSNSNINLVPNGIGEVIMGDILFTGTTLTNTSPSANTVIQNTASGYVKFNSSTALAIPTGDTSSRPLAPEVGDLRFNTELSAPEVFNGIAYSTLAGASSNATLTEIQELNEIFAILLG